MQICPNHKTTIRFALRTQNAPGGEDAAFQAESLILQNAIMRDHSLVMTGPDVCPLCEQTPWDAAVWQQEAAKSIAMDRRNPE